MITIFLVCVTLATNCVATSEDAMPYINRGDRSRFTYEYRDVEHPDDHLSRTEQARVEGSSVNEKLNVLSSGDRAHAIVALNSLAEPGKAVVENCAALLQRAAGPREGAILQTFAVGLGMPPGTEPGRAAAVDRLLDYMERALAVDSPFVTRAQKINVPCDCVFANFDAYVYTRHGVDRVQQLLTHELQTPDKDVQYQCINLLRAMGVQCPERTEAIITALRTFVKTAHRGNVEVASFCCGNSLTRRGGEKST
jgi:hypothetical protein